MALGRLGETQAIDSLLEPGTNQSEPFLSHAARYSATNLSRFVLHSDADDSAGFKNVRIAPTRKALSTRTQ